VQRSSFCTKYELEDGFPSLSMRLLMFFVWCAQGLRDYPPQGRDPFIPDYAVNYYYTSLKEKMWESLSVSNCTIASNAFVPDGGYAAREGSAPDIYATVIPPRPSVIRRWNSILDAETPSNSTSRRKKSASETKTFRQFVQITNNLCKSELFAKFKRGEYARGKGCFKMMRYDKNNRPYKMVNAYGATLHPDHARCNFKQSAETCVTGSFRPTQLNSPKRANTQYPFLLEMKNALVARSGMVALPCGPFGLLSSCEAVNWGLAAAIDMVPHVHECFTPSAASNAAAGHGAHPDDPHEEDHCPYRRVDRIFLTSQYDDTQIGQFILESLPRLVYHLPLLYANPDIKIHFGFTKQPVLPIEVLPHTIFRWLGLYDRLVNGTVFAKHVYMPRDGACQEPGYNMWELFNLREVFLARAAKELGTGGRNNSRGWPSRSFGDEEIMRPEFDLDTDGSPNLDKPLIVIIKRSSSSYTKNQNDYTRRRWPSRHGGAQAVREQLLRVFPSHRVKIFSDQDYEMMNCMACQVQIFSKAAIVVAMHGAGLTNTIYMEPGGVVVECVPNFDSRMAPIVGIFPRLSAIAGLHHFSYWIPDNAGFSPAALANATRDFHRDVTLWSH
jgi:hypothetical protein